METHKFTIELPKELFKFLKQTALNYDTTMREIIIQLLSDLRNKDEK